MRSETDLVVGEAVLLDLRPAHVASRLLAALLDGLVLLALGLAGVYLFSRLPMDLDPAAAAAVGTAFFLALVVGYPATWETLTRGRTPGKMALGLRVVRDDGGPVRFRQSLTRGLTLLVDLPTLYLPSLLVQSLSERSKRLGDVLAGTFVVQERVPAAAATVEAPPMPASLAGWAGSLDLARLPDGLALQMRQFLTRAPNLTSASRERIGAELCRAVAATTAPPPPPGTPGWAYLAAVLAERRRRAARLPTLSLPDTGSAPPDSGLPSGHPPVAPQPSPRGHEPADVEPVEATDPVVGGFALPR